MSRRSFFVAVGIVVFLICSVGTCLVLLLHYEPNHYRRCAVPPGLTGDEWVFADFDDFINNYMAAYACLQHESDFRRIAYEFYQVKGR